MTVLIIESEELFDWAPEQRLDQPPPAGPEDQWFVRRSDVPCQDRTAADHEESRDA